MIQKVKPNKSIETEWGECGAIYHQVTFDRRGKAIGMTAQIRCPLCEKWFEADEEELLKGELLKEICKKTSKVL